jgi:MFS transporter, FHS family, glucose/mannose:H+ symporter
VTGGEERVRLSGRALLALHAAFLLSGAVTVILGPLLPALGERWGLTAREGATLFLAQFAANSAAAVLAGRRLRRSLVQGYLLIGAGLGLIVAAGRPTAAAAMALVGWGLGLSIPASNLLVARAHPDRRGAALSKLNLAWGLGAFSSPLLFAALESRDPARSAPVVLALAAGAAALGLARALPPHVLAAPVVREEGGTGTAAPLVLLGTELFLYAGIETSIGGWLVALASQVAPGAGTAALLIGSGFWGSLLAGRAIVPMLLRRLSEPALLRWSLLLALLGGAGLVLARSRGVLAGGAVLAGVGLAPLFPLIVAAVTAEAEACGSRRGGAVFAGASLGAAVLPWLTGRAAGAGVQTAFLIPLGASVCLALLAALNRAHADRGR